MTDAQPMVGRLQGRAHIFPIRVYFEDTDAAGIVYYANYLKFAERARTETMRALGVDHGIMFRDGTYFIVRRCEIDYVRPAHLDDLLEVHSEFAEIGGASLSVRQVVRRGGAELARLAVKLACVGSDGRPARIPQSVRAIIETFNEKQD
jgi:acyl-CoA thioester hydrolase